MRLCSPGALLVSEAIWLRVRCGLHDADTFLRGFFASRYQLNAFQHFVVKALDPLEIGFDALEIGFLTTRDE